MGSQQQYDKIRMLGKGSFGTATVHRRRADSSLVVLKEIDLQRFKGERERLSAMNEARIMANLSHDNIIKYFNAYTTDTKLIIEMEYASIGTLAAYLSLQMQPLEERDILVIFKQIVSGLDYLHSMEVMHLDLKMTNIFVTNEGQVKIGDFGLAQYLSCSTSEGFDNFQPAGPPEKQRAERRLTSTHLLGTLAYSSPERCLGQLCDFKSDIWSLGCILYELIVSRPLFAAESLSELVQNITRIHYQPIKRQLMPAIREMFESAIAREPERRPDSGQLLAMTDQLLSRLQLRQLRLTDSSHRRFNPTNRFDLSTEMANFSMAGRSTEASQINYLHSLVYQVRLDSRNIHVDRVNLPQSKRIKQISKGASHYLVLTYDSIVYGWGSRSHGQLGACGLSSSTGSGRAWLRGFRSARSSMSSKRGNQSGQVAKSFISAASSPASSNQNLASSSTTLHSRSTLVSSAAAPADSGKSSGNQQASLSRQLIMHMLEQSKPSSRPTIVNELNHWKITQVAAGDNFSVFLSKTGLVMTCGDGSTGCLGRGTLASTYTPCMVESLLNTDVVSIACGPQHVVAVCGNGRVFAWGKNRNGRLGLGARQLTSEVRSGRQSDSFSRPTSHIAASHQPPEMAHEQQTYQSRALTKYITLPQLVQFPPSVHIRSAYCGDKCSIFIDSDSRCWACGDNRFNKLGLDIKRSFRKPLLVNESWLPSKILALDKFKIVSCSVSENHSTFLTSTGKLLVYGQDIDYDYRLRNNIVSDRDSHRRITQQLQAANGTTNYRLRPPLNVLPVTNQQHATANEISQQPNGLTASKDSLCQLSQSMSTIQSGADARIRYPEPLERAGRMQKRQLELYAKRTRSNKRMPFECVVSSSCTPRFTLALTNDNRVYFWGTRSYKKHDLECYSMSILPGPNKTSEPQLVAACSDECFVKIGPTNNSLMSNIQILGSDQPIIHAQDPKLVAKSLSDLWILDYEPTVLCSCSATSSLNSPVSSIDSLCDQLDDSCSSCSTCSSSNINQPIPRMNLNQQPESHDCCSCCSLDENNLDDHLRHDAILEPQPIISLYVPSMFRGSSLHLVNLFCFDEDRFYLVLDTTIMLPQQQKANPRSKSNGSQVLDQLNQPAGGHRSRLNSLDEPNASYLRRSLLTERDNSKVSGSQRSLDHIDLRKSCPKLTALGEEPMKTRPGAILEVSDLTPETTHPIDVNQQSTGCSSLAKSCQDIDNNNNCENDVNSDGNNNLVDTLSCPSAGKQTNNSDSNTDVTLISSNQGTSLDEPRSLSTFAATSTAGNHMVTMGPSLRRPMMSGEQSYHEINFDSDSRPSAGGVYTSSAREAPRRISLSSGARPLARAHSDRLSPVASSIMRRQRCRKNRQSFNKSESTTTNTCNEFDETSSLPSWVRNEYMEQQREELDVLARRSDDVMFDIDSSTGDDHDGTNDDTNGGTCVSDLSISASANETMLEMDVNRFSELTFTSPHSNFSTGQNYDAEHAGSHNSFGASAQVAETRLSHLAATKAHLTISMSQPDMAQAMKQLASSDHNRMGAEQIERKNDQLAYQTTATAEDLSSMRTCNGNLLGCNIYQSANQQHHYQSSLLNSGFSSLSNSNNHLLLLNSQPSVVHLDSCPALLNGEHNLAMNSPQVAHRADDATYARLDTNRLSKSSTQLASILPHQQRRQRSIGSNKLDSSKGVSLGSALRKSLIKLFC